MNRKKLLNFHSSYVHTYFITITFKSENSNIEEMYKKFKDYLYNHDENSHIKSVKEYFEKSHDLQYYILYFTNKELNYSRIHKKMPSNTRIHIEKVSKSKTNIEKIIKNMKKIKENNKSKPLSNRNNSELKVIPRIALSDFKTNS